MSFTGHLFDWIVLAPKAVLPENSKTLYWLLKSFLIEGQEPVLQITQEDLADIREWSVDTVQRALKPLYALGLVTDRERRKVSTRVPGKPRPIVTTHLVMQINEIEPPAGYTGWLSPFEARKAVRARRAATAAEQDAVSDTADLRPQSDQHVVDNSSAAAVDDTAGQDVSAGQCDTANLPETGADLRQNCAGMRRIGSNPSGTNPSGTGGRNAAPQTPASRSDGHPAQSVHDQNEFVGDHQDARAEKGTHAHDAREEAGQPELDVLPEIVTVEAGSSSWWAWGVHELRQELDRRCDSTVRQVEHPDNVAVIRSIQRALRARGAPIDVECAVQLPDPSVLAHVDVDDEPPARRRSRRTRAGDRRPAQPVQAGPASTPARRKPSNTKCHHGLKRRIRADGQPHCALCRLYGPDHNPHAPTTGQELAA